MPNRAGLRFAFPTGPHIRLGYAILKSPQPNETFGAFLAGVNRNTITAGLDLDWLDLAVAWTQQSERSIITNVDAERTLSLWTRVGSGLCFL